MANAVGNMRRPAPTTPVERVPSFATFLKAVANGNGAECDRYGLGYRTENVRQVTKTSMGETSGSIGGYIVPVEYSKKLLKTVEEESFFYKRAERIPMKSASLIAPTVNATTAQSTGVAPFFGGMTFTWGASQTPVETEPTFRSLTLNAWDLLGYATVSNQFLADMEESGEDGEDYLIDLFGKAASWYVEYALFNGVGAPSSMPLGILNAPGAKLITRAGSSAISEADLANMAAAMLPYGWKNAVWACSPTALAKVMQDTGWQPNESPFGVQPGSAGSLMSRPLFVTDKLPTLGTAGDLVFFDPTLYVVGVRQEVLVDSSTLGPAFRNYSTDFRIWVRMDGKPRLDNVVTLPNTSTVAAYVILN